jgi:glycosyltransferase involved in cell wall biosynthesis
VTIDVLVVPGTKLSPAHGGGRIRAARIVEQLGRRLQVVTLVPGEVASGRFAGVASGLPRLGHTMLGAERLDALRSAVVRERPEVVLFLASYLAAMAPTLGVPVAVDFADVEVLRMASFARLAGLPLRSRAAAGWEAVKARRWEPAVARRSVLASTPSADDVALLASWGAPAVHVPNGADRCAISPSPVGGPVTFVASFDYRANAEAARFLVREVWPLVKRAEPGVRLRLAGRDAGGVAVAQVEGVEAVPDPVDMEPIYAEASVVMAPVRGGGGSQMKVTEALARGRVVVATPYSARSAPAAAAGAVVQAGDAASMATAVVHLWRDVAARRAAEKVLADGPVVPTWDEACAPLADGLERLVRPR